MSVLCIYIFMQINLIMYLGKSHSHLLFPLPPFFLESLELFYLKTPTILLVFSPLVIFEVTPSAQGLFLDLCTGITPGYGWGDLVGFQGSNLRWLHTRQVPYSLYYQSSPEWSFKTPYSICTACTIKDDSLKTEILVLTKEHEQLPYSWSAIYFDTI